MTGREISAAVVAVAGELAFDEYDVLAFAMELFRDRKLDFVDCVLAARAAIRQDEVFSFDKKLLAAIESLRS